MPCVLLTRPRAQSEAFARSIAAEGWEALIWPAMEIATLLEAPPDLSETDALVFTSARAVEALAPFGGLDLPAFCVGPGTTAAARAAGFAEIHEAGGDAARLIDTLKVRARGRLLHVRGRDAAADIAGALRAAGMRAEELVVYAAEPGGPPGAGVLSAMEDQSIDVALFFSPRSSSLFARAAPPGWRAAYPGMRAGAISAAVAAPLRDLGFRETAVAAAPNAHEMRVLLRRDA